MPKRTELACRPFPRSFGAEEFDLSFKVFHELMARKVTDILLISSPYEAFIMEEEGRLAERIIHEYRGLNLSRPPMLTWVSTSAEALEALGRRKFDLVITMPLVDEMDANELGRAIKAQYPELPVFLLLHRSGRQILEEATFDPAAIDRVYVWQGNADLLLALIKNLEDRMNVVYDTERARVRVLLLVEDSPVHYSALLPILYKEVVSQTQAVMEDSINDEHRIFRMRARPKVLLARSFEEATDLCRRFRPYLLGVLSDVRFPRGGRLDDAAGFALLAQIRAEEPDLPLLVLSTEEANRERALAIPAAFINKSSPTLHAEIHDFFIQFLGFGDFVFRTPEGREIGRASNLEEMEKLLPGIPEESVAYHAGRNHFSSWLMARSEIMLASRLRPMRLEDFASVAALKRFLVEAIRERRRGIRRGVIAAMATDRFDPEADFTKIGRGSLGGKARGLAFAASLLRDCGDPWGDLPEVEVRIPKALAVSTEAFDAFIAENRLERFAAEDAEEEEVARAFLAARLPDCLRRQLALFLEHTRCPLAVRSSSLLEDAQFQPFAGIYRTYMLANNEETLEGRLARLESAVKAVYASTYYRNPKSFARSMGHHLGEEKMGVLIQHLTGTAWRGLFFPAVAGVLQSWNFYPIGPMRAEEGIAHIALGLGKTVVEGETALRFSPRHPQHLPQFSTVEDILRNCQKHFFALRLAGTPPIVGAEEDPAVVRVAVDEAADSPAVRRLADTYVAAEHRIREGVTGEGPPILTFSGILRYREFPLDEILNRLLEIGRRGMGCAIEIEFAVDFPEGRRPVFDLLQIRPMTIARQRARVEIGEAECRRAVCRSQTALGNGVTSGICDIVYVDPEAFDPARTVEIASEVGRLNRKLEAEGRPYFLIGPGRWGSADRWLGIPVKWSDISAVKAVAETASPLLRADPSQGSHFFHNITSLGICYLTVSENGEDFVDWGWLGAQPLVERTRHLRHVRPERPLTIKIDGRRSLAVVLPGEDQREA